MISSAVARRYARGLLGAAVDRGEDIEALTAQLREIGATVSEHNGLELLVLNPAVDSDRKGAVLKDIADRLGAGEMAKRFIEVLAHNDRLDHLREAVDAFGTLADEHLGVVNAVITAPLPLDEAAVTTLKDKLAQATGRAVRIEVKTDPELLGGLTTRIGDVVYDGSLRHQLNQMREQIAAS